MSEGDNDNFFSDNEVTEQVEVIKKEKESREVEEKSLQRGFTIVCNNCGEKLNLNKNEKSTGVISYEAHQTETIRLGCSCGNLYTRERWGGYTPN